MTTIRQKQYDLNCKTGEYEALLKSLQTIASGHFPTDERGWTDYIVSSEKVDLSFKDNREKTEKGLEGEVLMSVKRTSLREPKFVKQIIKRLEGRQTSSAGYSNEGIVSLFLGDSSEEFALRKK